jgi:hypothetical protein
MLKLPHDPDQFKHFKADPPEIKLEAWKQLQRRLTIRDLVFGLICACSALSAIWFRR